MPRVHAVLLGAPVPKGAPRARIIYVGGKPRPALHNDETTARYLRKLGITMLAARNKAGIYKPLLGPIKISAFAFFGDCPSDLKKKHGSFLIRKFTRPDYDNILKIIGDAGNGVLWRDDGQICEAHSYKLYCQPETPPRLEVVMETVTEAFPVVTAGV